MNATNTPPPLSPVVAGEPYLTTDNKLSNARQHAFLLCSKFNALPPAESAQRALLLSDLFAKAKGVQVASTLSVEYGINTHLGKGTFLNHHVCIIDACPVHIGNQVLIGPNTVISTVVGRFTPGPSQPQETALPVTLGHRIWIGANVYISAGVTIGDNCVIGAGSVVTQSLPANALAYGHPAKVIRKIQQNPQ